MKNAKHCNQKIHDIIVQSVSRFMQAADDERGSIFSTASNSLQLFKDPLVEHATSESDFCLNDFAVSEKPLSFYITIPFGDLERLSPVVRLLITCILNKFSQGETQYGEIRLKNPILLLIDEFPTLGAFPIIETMMGILNGYGMRFFLICQSLTQIIKLYGEQTPILDHCRFMATYAMSDLKSAETFSKMIGVESVDINNVSNSGSRYEFGMNNLNVGEQTIQRNLINADELMHLPPNQMIVFGQGMVPAICKKNVYYEDKRYNTKVKLKGPKLRNELIEFCKYSTRPKLGAPQWNDIGAEMYLEDGGIELTAVKEELPSKEEFDKMANTMQKAALA